MIHVFAVCFVVNCMLLQCCCDMFSLAAARDQVSWTSHSNQEIELIMLMDKSKNTSYDRIHLRGCQCCLMSILHLDSFYPQLFSFSLPIPSIYPWKSSLFQHAPRFRKISQEALGKHYGSLVRWQLGPRTWAHGTGQVADPRKKKSIFLGDQTAHLPLSQPPWEGGGMAILTPQAAPLEAGVSWFDFKGRAVKLVSQL